MKPADTNASAPGQQRPYPKPTNTGKISFTYAQTGLQGETAYYLWGDLSCSKTPLICLHGGPGIPHGYILPISLIYEDYGIPVLMYDQIGCGESTAFPDKKHDANFWTPELFMAELDNVKQHLSIQKFDLLGQSWGAMLAGQYAINQPQGLRKLIIEGGPDDMISYAHTSQKLRSQLPQEMQETLNLGERSGNLESEGYKAAEMYFYSLHVCRTSRWPRELLDAFGQLEVDPTVYHTMMGPNEFQANGTLKDWSIKDELHKITEKTVPGGLLLMNGQYDTVQDETTSGFFYKPSCKVKWVRYGLSGHLPMLEETEKFVRDLGAFLMDE